MLTNKKIPFVKISREVKTALLALVGIALFISGYSYLKANPVWSSARTFYAVYDNVGGLVPGTSVTINGLPVGKIQNIKFLNDSGKLLVTFNVEDDFPFSENSKAVIYEAGFIGGKALSVELAQDDAPPAKSGDTLSIGYRQGFTEAIEAKLAPLQDNIESFIVHADSLMQNVNMVFDEENRANLKAGLASLDQTLNTFKRTSRSLDALVSDNKQKLDNSIGNFEKISTDLNGVTSSLAQADIETTVKDLQATIGSLNGMMKKIESGEGSLGKLLQDEGLYKNLDDASNQLELLLQDMRLNPKRYVHFSLFGKRQRQYEVPEDDPALQENND